MDEEIVDFYWIIQGRYGDMPWETLTHALRYMSQVENEFSDLSRIRRFDELRICTVAVAATGLMKP